MGERESEGNVAISMIEGALLVCVQTELRLSTLLELQNRLLEQVSKLAVKGVMLDLSEVDALDVDGFSSLIDLTQMLKIMGAKTVFIGFRPGVVAGLAALDSDLSALRGCQTIRQALDLLHEA
jgi:rsbT antagonist protein RsbS